MSSPATPRPQGSVPPSLLMIADRVEKRLARLFDHEEHRWADLSADLRPPIDSLRRLVMAGGKRLRPAFCHWGFVGAGGDPGDPDVVDAGAAFELLQAFALVHDDVMDGSATRRGARTAHLAFGDHHEDNEWRGERRRFGEGVAILIGDLAHVYADVLVPATNPEVTRVWNELRVELNIGQYLDVLGTARGDVDEAGARQIARYKSGKYTIERPLHVGAALAGQLHELEQVLSAYGDPLGEAFQLRDDVLGAFGESDLTGKPVGDDLREGKPTPLLAIASANADAPSARVLEMVGSRDLSESEVVEIQRVIVDTGALDEVETLIEHLTSRAVDAITDADVIEEARTALVELADFVAWRSA